MTHWKLKDLTPKQRDLLTRNTAKHLWLQDGRIRPDMPEKKFQDYVMELAAARGWEWVWHDYDSRRNRSGKPDLELGHPERGVFFMAELKTRNNKPQPKQVEAIQILERCGVKVYLWYPRDWPEIVEVLW